MCVHCFVSRGIFVPVHDVSIHEVVPRLLACVYIKAFLRGQGRGRGMSLLSLLFPLLRLIHPYISKGALFSNYQMRLNEWMTRRIMQIEENVGDPLKSSVTVVITV